MAELLTKIPTSVTEYPKSFKRQGCFPLEAYSVFYATADKTAFEAAQAYASTNAIAYVGQTLAVVTTKTEDPTIVDNVTFYIIADAAGTLQEVGKATNGDGKSIVLTDGILSLAGFDAAQAATLPQKQADGTIKWVPIDSIVEGDTNTKTVIAAGDEEVHVSVELVRDDSTDTNTYKISLDLSAYATTSDVETAIQAVEDKFDEAIGAAADGENAATGVYAAIDAALEAAKAYADENDADTIYDDSALSARVKSIEDDYLKEEDKYDDTELVGRVSALEEVVGDAEDGLVKDVTDNAKAIDDEAKARAQGDADTLNSAKAYTDEEIVGLDISIEKKTVNEVESDYIVIKNKAGTEVASVNAAKFVKDGMLGKAEYDKDSKVLTLTWNTDAGKNATEIELNDLIDTYTGSDHIEVGTDGVISIKDTVALKTDLSDAIAPLATTEALNEVKAIAEAAQTAEQVSNSITAAVAAHKTEAANLYVDKVTYSQHLPTKLDVETYNTDKQELNTKLMNKVEYTTLASTYYNKTEIENKGYAVATDVANTYATKAELTEHANAAEATYAKASEVEAELAKKANADSVYTKTEIDAKIGTPGTPAVKDEEGNVTAEAVAGSGVYQHVYSKDEVTSLIADITGGESAADVLAALNAYKTTNDTRVKSVEDVNASQATAIETAQAQADKGVADALAAQNTANGALSAITLLTEGQVATNANDIATLTGIVTDDHAIRLGTLESYKTTHTEEFNTLKGRVENNETEIGKKANAADVYTVTAVNGLLADKADKSTIYTKTEIDETIAAIQASVDAGVLAADFESYKTTTAATIATLATKSELEAVDAKFAAKANAVDVYTKTEADAEFMTQDEVDARINALINAADPEGGKAISDIQNLVKYVEENAGEIAGLVTTVGGHTAAIADNKAAHEKNASDIIAINSDIVAINALIAANEVKESTEISVTAITGEGATGVQLGIKEVNVNKLVQDEDDVLILNGGSAGTKAE